MFWSLAGRLALEWSDVETAEKGLEQVVPPLQQMTHIATPYDHLIGMAADDTAMLQQKGCNHLDDQRQMHVPPGCKSAIQAAVAVYSGSICA